MKTFTVLVALIFSVCIAACSDLSEEDLADLRSPNEMSQMRAIEKISKGERFPAGLFDGLFGRNIEKRAVVIMTELLREGDSSEDIQLSILRALGELGRRTEVAVSPIIEKLNEGSRIRSQAVESLGKIRDRESVPVLLQVLEEEKNKYPIIWALGEIGDKRAVPALNRLLASEDKYARYNARNALKKIR